MNSLPASTKAPSGRAHRAAPWLVAAVFGLAFAHAGPGITGLPAVRTRGFRRLAGQGDADHVALTFDDGPDPESTPRFLQALDERGIRATFFMLGSMVEKAPGLAAEIAAAGHDVGVHGFDHRYLTVRGPRATRSDLTRARDLIADVTGRQPALFRPPYGVLTGAALLTVRELGLTPVLWRSWGREWTPAATPQSVVRTLVNGLDGGVTVLLHDSGCTSPPGAWQKGLAAVPLLLDECEHRGLRVGPLAEHGLLGRC